MSERTPKEIGKSVRYTPPRTVKEIATTEVGFARDYTLRVPRLFAVGDLSLLQEPSVAIVGSRRASSEGQKRAAQLARALVREAVVVMSGLAAGIDAAAHRTAVSNGGRTIAVIGTPVDKAYPKENATLQETIYREHLLLSQFAIGMRTFPSSFPERNRVMARLAMATVIIEAGDTSGSLHQAAESLLVGHPVFIAKSVLENTSLSWPARFAGKPNVFTLEDASDVLDVVLCR